MNYDETLLHLGELGLWQKLVHTYNFIFPIAAGMYAIQFYFAGFEPSAFRCQIKDCEGTNSTFDYFNSTIFPLDENGNPDYCLNYAYNASDDDFGTCSYENFDYSSTVKCTAKEHIFYDSFEFDNSVATEFNLVCGDQYKVALAGSIFMVGLMFGSFFLGWLSDRFGRLPALMLSVVFGSAGGLAGAFVNDYVSYAVTRFFTGIGGMGLMLLPFSISVEMCGPLTKTAFGNMIQAPFAVGEAIISVIAMLVRDWRTFQIVTSAPLLAMLLLWPIMAESPRWLIANKKYDRVQKLLKKAAKMNKVNIPEHLLEVPKEDSKADHGREKAPEQKLGFKSLFATRTITRNTVVMIFDWIMVTLGYYGISMSMGNLGTDVFVNMILVSLIEIPSLVACWLLMDKMGRKPLLVYALAITGIPCIAAAFTPDGAGKTALALIGKFGAAGAFAIVYMYTAELYPTQIRTTAMGTCSMFARIGGIAAPQVALYLPAVTFDAFPLLLMGGGATIASALTLLLPETLGASMAETLEEIETMGQDAKPFFGWWTKKRLQEQLQKHHWQRMQTNDKEREAEKQQP